VTKKIHGKHDKTRHVHNSWKEERIIPSSILEVLYVAIYADAISLAISAYTNGWKISSLKTATHHMKWRRTVETCKFKRIKRKFLYTKETLFNITYIHSMEHRAMCLLNRRYDLAATGYKYLKIGINVGPPSYVEIALEDHRGHELSLSLEMWKGLYK